MTAVHARATSLGLSSNPEPEFDVPYFDLVGPSLTINVTDTPTEQAVRPPEKIVDDEKGRKKYYTREPLNSDTNKFWRRRIATELVHKFLLKYQDKQRTYTLTNFPEGYYLYIHNVSTKRGRADIRTDGYIYGGGKKFRSTHEAIPHLAWIMHGMQPNRCKCIYDTPDKATRRKQGALNKELEESWKEFINEKAKKDYQDWQERKQNNRPYVPPPPTVNVFNERMFLRPPS